MMFIQISALMYCVPMKSQVKQNCDLKTQHSNVIFQHNVMVKQLNRPILCSFRIYTYKSILMFFFTFRIRSDIIPNMPFRQYLLHEHSIH
ncbi:Os02g0728401 [Oryza sativa Japonica Group]|jgi:hypothetical protein|uniref:Os02g0728401 protein n=1 Tax=Oryza sativa subsp. japonica TaxID=39947 RepID=A0A0P0VP00_ORYSJ|nr:hypothetical protein EE612_013430 [Oryza sativa]BAS80719.1 Os02g0728401 [Oryza sativa Japonica Group]